MSGDVLVCTKCGKYLRRDNVAGICGDAKACRARVAGAAAAVYDVKAPSESVARKPKSDSALKRFRVVADALGEDADALLEAFAESWLAQLKGRLTSED